MPQAVAHILVPLVLVSLFRDYLVKKRIKKNKKKFPLIYALIAGLAGIIPDLDIAAFWILYFFEFTFEGVHRTFMHTLFIPLIFILLASIFYNLKNPKYLEKNKLKLWIIFLMISLGSFIHLILDATFQGTINPLYPILDFRIGLNLLRYLPDTLERLAAPSIDAALLIIWLVYLEWKHKISSFI